MLFNSFEFIFVFLPITILVFHLIGKQGHHRVAIAWLVGASLFFYGWWNPAYLGLMIFSILYERDNFYDTGYHLNEEAQLSHSKELANYLEKYIK